MKYYEKIKMLRVNQHLTQADIANKIGVTKSAIAMYEKGEREPSLETIKKIAELLNVDMNYLFNSSEATHSEDDELMYKIDKPVEKAAQFCDRLSEALSLRNTKPAVLSYKTRISESALSHYIAGHYVPKFEKLNKIAYALHVSPEWLQGYDVPMESTPVFNDEKRVNQRPEAEEFPDDVIIYRVNSRTVRKHFSKKQLSAVITILESLPGETEEDI